MEDNHKHVLTCKGVQASEQKKESLTTLEKTLIEAHTYPDLVSLMVLGVQGKSHKN